MPAPSFLKGLPKPVLFGLYGAVGGLIGAVLLGEPLWRVLKPPPAPPAAPQVAVGASSLVRIYPGTENGFVVRVVRERFTGPVTVKFDTNAAGLTLAPLAVLPESSEATAKVSAAAEMVPGKHTVTITAEAEGKIATATTTMEVEVVTPPPPPPAIALAVPANFTVYKKGSGKFVASVARRNFNGEVKITVVPPLPAGISVEPAVIPAGKPEVEVTLKADDTAALGGAKLTVNAEALGAPLRVSAPTQLGVANPPVAPVDIVFVLDVTSSMQWAIDDLKNGIGKFADTLSKNQLNFRLGLVTFQDLAVPGEKVEVVMFGNAQKEEPFTSDAVVFRDKVGLLRARGGGDIPESSLEAVTEAAKLPFRQGATKILLLITDAPPKVREVRADDAVKVVKDNGIDSVHIVIQRFDLDVYKPLTEAGTGKTGGKYFNLGDVVRGDEGFDGLLDTFGKAVAAAALAREPDTKPEVAPPPKPPELAATAAATPKAAEAPPVPSVKSLQSGEGAAAGSEGRLVLQSGVWTGCIAALVCLALLAGQHHYLRGSLPAMGGVLVGLVGGLAVGLIGGAAGQGLYTLAQGSTLGAVFQVLGWALLGGLAGVGLSLFIPNMKWPLGLAGGAIGGAVGGIGFIAVSNAAGDLVGRLVGGILIGFCIGLMVALVESAFRRVWLEVRYGSRETITVNLGPEPVKVGGDAKACTVWARGASPVALRFFLRDGQVICDDAVMRRETVVSDGFAKEVGNVTVTVRTGSGATATAAPQPSRPVSSPVPKPTASRLEDDDFGLPMAVVPPPPSPKAVPAAKPQAALPAAEPLSLDDDATPPHIPVAVPPPAPPPPAPKLPAPKPPVPVASKPPAPVASKPPAASVPPKPPAASVPPKAPPPPAGAKHPDACPGCGRVNAGKPKQRYCMVCDNTY